MLANNGIARWGLLGRIAGVLVAACCLGYSAWYQAPVNDEFGHFYAGLRYWQYGDVETFKVNPPLLRSLATLPAYLAGMECGQPEDVNQITPLRDRPEFQRGRQLFIQDPSRFQFWLSVGRMLVWSTTILGGVLLYHAAKVHVGIIAGTLAAGLWFAQPQILSHGVLITGDVFCAVIMLATVMTLQWSLRKLTMARSLMLGGMLGLSILAKFTAMVLVPLIFLTFAWHADRYTLKRLLGCIVAGLLATMFVLGLPYGFADWGQSLSEYEFVSGIFTDLQTNLGKALAWFPIPLPEQLVLGLDRQQLDFETGLPSYAAGLYGRHGWWWFYLYSMAVKLPVGTLLAIGVTVILLIRDWKRLAHYIAVPLLVFQLMVLVTCLQSGFAQQHRYILPAYPFLFWVIGVAGGRVLQNDANLGLKRGLTLWRRDDFPGIPGFAGEGQTPFQTVPRLSSTSQKIIAKMVSLGLLLTIVGTASAGPHWLSAFNFLAGGNRSGYKCLFNDASDWGQDTFRVRDWINAHAGDVPIYVRSSFCGEEEIRATGAVDFYGPVYAIDDLPRPCWLVLSKSNLAIDAPLAEQVRPLEVAEYLAGSHLVYFLPTKDLNSSIRIKNAAESPSQ